MSHFILRSATCVTRHMSSRIMNELPNGTSEFDARKAHAVKRVGVTFYVGIILLDQHQFTPVNCSDQTKRRSGVLVAAVAIIYFS